MMDSDNKRQLFSLLVLASVLAPAAVAQPGYIITTIAGGGPPNGVASTSVGLSYVYGVAGDGAGNVYVAAAMQNRIYKAALDGTISTVAGTGASGFSGDNGPAASALLNYPIGVAVDGTGNLYIADLGNARIRKVSGGIITTVAGNGMFGSSGDNGPATSAQFSPSGVAVDGAGNFYIADGNSRIRKVSAGIITTFAGNGSPGFSGDTGPAISAQIGHPNGVAVDGSGILYIADSDNYRIRKVEGGVITTVAGNGIGGYSGDNGLATSANLNYPYGVAVDNNGNLFIADGNNARIRKVTTGVISTVAGNGSWGYSGDNGPALNAQLSLAGGVALDGAGNIYVADTYNYRVRKIASGVISTVVGNGSYQYSGDNGLAARAQFSPQGVAVQSPGNFYIADAPDFRIRNVTGGWITTVAGNGVCCYNGDNIPATSAQIGSAAGIAVDSFGNLYTAESSRVRKVSGGTISAFAGNGLSGFSGDNGPATSAQLSSTRVAVDNAGNVYIADQANNRVRKVSGGVITTVAGGGPADGVAATSISLGQAIGVATDAAGNLYVPSGSDNRVYKVSTNGVITTVAGSGSSGFSGDNGPATTAQLNYPFGVAVNSAGTVVYIADRNNNRVRMVSGGQISTVAGGGSGCAQQTNLVGDGCPGTSATLSFPAKLALDASGTNLYIADATNYRIRKLTGGVITTVAGSGICTPTSSTDRTCLALGDNGPATSAQLNYATGIAIDPNTGDLYIGDSENFRVRKVSGGVITTVAGTGAYGYAGDGAAPTSAMLSYCYGVAVDTAGNLYIADAANHRIRKVAGGVITTVAGNGNYGYSGDGGAPTGTELWNPYDVAVDGIGNLYIADTNNYRIRKVSGGTIATVAGNGLLSYSGDGGTATGAQLNQPSALAVDGAGNLYISDSGNYRIRQVSAGGTITTVAGNGVYGVSGEYVPATSPIGNTSAIAADSGGNLYAAESNFNRIRKVSGGVVFTIAGNGIGGYSGDGGPAISAELSNPQGVAVDSAGNVYIADAGNSSIRLLTTSPRAITSIAPPSVLAGTSGFTLVVNGSGFVNGDNVLWNGAVQPTTFVNSGQLTAPISSGQIAQPGAAVVSVNGLSNAVTFTISSCSYSLNPTSALTTFISGSGSFAVTATTGCSWTAVSNASWLTVTSGASGTGNGTVGYSVAANPNGTPRSATITVGGQTFALTQTGIIVTGLGLRFVTVTPCRIADTRNATGPFGGPNLDAAVGRDFNIPASPCGIPASALAYSLNLTVVPIGGLGFLSVWPAGQSQPVVSTLNSGDGRIKANAAIVPAGLNGAITVFASNTTHVIVDINGYFVLASGAQNLAFYPIAPCRLADTRIGTGTFAGPALAAAVGRDFPVLSGSCGIPATAQAYATNMTVVPSGPLGFLSAWPSGSPQPGSSTLNAPTGTVTSNMAIIPAGAAGAITVIATNATDLVIDITGYFAPPGAGSLDFYTATPCRILDTRGATGAFGGPIMGATESRAFPVPSSACNIPGTAKAYSLNATVVPPAPLGFLQLWGSGSQPTVSTLNSYDGTIVANAALVPSGTSGVVTAFTSSASHLILDINGYFQ